MTRMTNEIRDAIRVAAIKAAFDDRAKAMDKIEDLLCREAYAHCYTAEEIAQTAALPDYWLRRDSCLNFIASGMRIKLCTVGNHHVVPYASKRTGSMGYHCHNDHGAIRNEALADRIVAHARAKEELRTARERATNNLAALLGRFPTVKKLAEAWPEGAPFYERYLDVKAPPPPAVRFDDVNAALGLAPA